MTVFVITDRLQHYYWKFMDPDHPIYDPASAAKYGDIIFEGYRKVDKAVGEIIKAIPEEAHIIIMSDHGFGPLQYAFFTNRWLQEHGLLSLHRQRTDWVMSTLSLERGMEKIGLSSLAKHFPGRIGTIRIPMIIRKEKSLLEAIDWEHTKAYATRWGININLKSREPFGIVEPGQSYEDLVNIIIKELREIKIPDTGTPMFDMVARKEDIYHGHYLNEAHDIIVASRKTGVFLKKDLFNPEIIRTAKPEDIGSGEHRLEGIFIIKGPSIEPESIPNSPRMEDIAPTILYLMGLPVPDYMDGKVLTPVIKQDILSQNPVVVTPHALSDRRILIKEPDDNEEQIKEQLKSLGYLG